MKKRMLKKVFFIFLVFGFDQVQGTLGSREQRANYINKIFPSQIADIISDYGGQPHAWQPIQGLVKKVSINQGQRARSIAVSPNGKYIAVGLNSGDIELFSTKNFSKKILSDESSKKNSLMAIAFSPNSNYLAEGCQNGKINIWSTDRQQLITVLNDHDGHKKAVRSLAFSSNGFLASALNDLTIKIWNTTSWSLIKILKVEKILSGVAFSPNDEYLASAGLNTKIWRVSDWSHIKDVIAGDDGWAISFSPDSNYVAIGLSGGVNIVATSDWATVQVLQDPSFGPCSSVVFSPNGRYLAFVAQKLPNDYLTSVWEKKLDGRWQLSEKIKSILPIEKNILGVVFSPDGAYIASLLSDGMTIFKLGLIEKRTAMVDSLMKLLFQKITNDPNARINMRKIIENSKGDIGQDSLILRLIKKIHAGNWNEAINIVKDRHSGRFYTGSLSYQLSDFTIDQLLESDNYRSVVSAIVSNDQLARFLDREQIGARMAKVKAWEEYKKMLKLTAKKAAQQVQDKPRGLKNGSSGISWQQLKKEAQDRLFEEIKKPVQAATE